MEQKNFCETCGNELEKGKALTFINKKRKYLTRYNCCICGYYSSTNLKKFDLHQGKCAECKKNGLCSFCKKPIINVGKGPKFNLCYNCYVRLI